MKTAATECWEQYCQGLPSLPCPERGLILVSGATGYIGGRLVPVLVQRGYRVRVMVRVMSEELQDRFPGCELIEADALDYPKLKRALKGVYAAYYLLHSLRLGHKNFELTDLKVAENFRRASEEGGVSRIIYLSGLGKDVPGLSPHLSNRMKVAWVLGDGPIPLTLLRAGMIIGSGSASYEILRHLVKNAYVFFIPYWARTNSQPIAIRDVIRYLVGVLEKLESTGRSYDIGGVDILTYDEKLRELSRMLGLRRWFFPAFISWTPLYGYIASLLTPVPGPITKVLIEGCKNEVICQNNGIIDLLPGHRLSFKEALLKAMTAEEKDAVHTRWSDAYPPESDLALKLHQLNYRPQFTSANLRMTHEKPEALFQAFCQVGGNSGWFHSNWMWRMRGMLDKILMGVGTARGRRSDASLRVNDVIDFWRVESIRENERLLLRAEMKLPGYAWLEFLTVEGEGINRLAVNAYFEPRGWFGKLYWYFFVPFHYIIFTNLLKQIEKRVMSGNSLTN